MAGRGDQGYRSQGATDSGVQVDCRSKGPSSGAGRRKPKLSSKREQEIVQGQESRKSRD